MARMLRSGAETDRDDAEPDALGEALRLGAVPLRRIIAWQIARTLLRLALAGTMAVLLGSWIMGGPAGSVLLPAIALLLVLAAAAGFRADRAEAEAQASLAAALRRRAGARLTAMPARAVQAMAPGELVVAMQRHPEAIAALALGHRAARSMMAMGPVCAAAALVCVSWQAALTVVVLTPVMVVFFVLVGAAIRTRAEARERAFGRLAGLFADRIRALPTILAHHALAIEADKLERRLDTHAIQTMGVLRIAFLNAGVIDFFASLSIAILAVLLGLGHLKLAAIPGFHDLALWQSLFVLMIAPDYFAPFRRYAEQYHAKADGLAAALALDRLLTRALPPRPRAAEVERIASEFVLPPRGLVALAGPSGAGKSTLLRRLAGLEPGRDVPSGSVAWIATDSFVPVGTLADALAWNAARPSEAHLVQAAGRVGLLDDALLPGGLEARLERGGANLSGGQRLRIATARALLADGAVFADEPTAKLDAVSAALVRDGLRAMASSRLVVVATHDPALMRLAARRIDLAAPNAVTEAEVP